MAYWILDLVSQADQCSELSPTASRIRNCLKMVAGLEPHAVRLDVKPTNGRDVVSGQSAERARLPYSPWSELLLDLRNVDQNTPDAQGIFFRGIFVVVSPNVNDAFWSIISKLRRDLLLCVGTGIATLHNAEPKFSYLGGMEDLIDTGALELQNFVLLLDLIARRNRVVIFVPECPASQQVDDKSLSLVSEDISKEAYFWQFKVECLDEVRDLLPYLLSRIGRDIFRMSPMVHERRDNRFVAEKAITPSSYLSCNLLLEEYWDWFRQEFGARHLAQAFLGNVWHSLCDRPEPGRDHHASAPILPWYAQVAIGVARMCRRMSTWTLEGAPFECTVVLQPSSSDEHLKAVGARFRALINIVPPCPFNFDHEEQIRNYAETAQSNALFMLVYAGDANLHHVATALGDSNHLPISYYTDLAKHFSMVFRVRPPGRVDVYTRDGLVMTHDGFRWIDDPLGGVRDAVSQHFRNISSGRENCITCLLEAVQMLLDRYESCIFILVDSKDKETARRLTREALRPTIMWSTSSMIRVDDLVPAALAGLLHLDGAHLFDDQGGLLTISKRISAGHARHEISITKEEFEHIQACLHLLPNGASIEQTLKPTCEGTKSSTTSSVEEELADGNVKSYFLLFAQRVELHWLDDWPVANPGSGIKAWMTPEIKRKITEAIIGELHEHDVLVIDATWNLIEYVRQLLAVKYSETWLRILLPAVPTSPVEPVKTVDSIDTVETATDAQSKPAAELSTRKALVRLRTIAIEDSAMEERKNIVRELLEVRGGQKQPRSFEFTRMHFFEGKLSSPLPLGEQTDHIVGLAYDQQCEFLVEASCLGKVVSAVEVPGAIYDKLSLWDQFRQTSKDSATGTGTRAAVELSEKLPHSTVIKVSASGKLKVYRSKAATQ